jgi:hypothetical protein
MLTLGEHVFAAHFDSPDHLVAIVVTIGIPGFLLCRIIREDGRELFLLYDELSLAHRHCRECGGEVSLNSVLLCAACEIALTSLANRCAVCHRMIDDGEELCTDCGESLGAMGHKNNRWRHRKSRFSGKMKL